MLANLEPRKRGTHALSCQTSLDCPNQSNDGSHAITALGRAPDWNGKNMFRRALCLLLFLTFAILDGLAAPFVVFPKAGQLASPDGRFVVHSVERESSAGELVGTFRSLWITEAETGHSRKLCDYLGVAAVAWSGNDFLIVTQYVGRRTSRTLVFSMSHPDQSFLLDAATLVNLVPAEFGATLRQNDHVFIEGSRADPESFYLSVWGYGQHDPNGFRWRCQYRLREGLITCTDARVSK